MIALASDHGGYELKNIIKKHLDSTGATYKDFGAFSTESCDYPAMVKPAVLAVSAGECELGVVFCGTGIGVSIAANKTPGIRAAVCTDTYMAEMARAHNDANILALGARVIDAETAIKIVDVFLNTGFEGGRHSVRVQMLNDLDRV